MFLLVPAYPGCPGSKAVKRSLLLYYGDWFIPFVGDDVVARGETGCFDLLECSVRDGDVV